MTMPEWMDAFRRGDPENIGKAVMECIQQAYDELAVTGNAPDIGELDQNSALARDFTVRVGQKMWEHGLLYQLSDQTPEDTRG